MQRLKEIKKPQYEKEKVEKFLHELGVLCKEHGFIVMATGADEEDWKGWTLQLLSLGETINNETVFQCDEFLRNLEMVVPQCLKKGWIHGKK